MVNSSPAENLQHKYPSYSSPKPKTLPNTNSSFESWLYHNASCLITHSALHCPRPFGFSFPLLTCIFIRRLIHIQIMPNYRAGLGCLHPVFEFLMLLKYFKCVITWHINQCSTVPPRYFLSSQVSVPIHQPLHRYFQNQLNSCNSAPQGTSSKLDSCSSVRNYFSHTVMPSKPHYTSWQNPCSFTVFTIFSLHVSVTW